MFKNTFYLFIFYFNCYFKNVIKIMVLQMIILANELNSEYLMTIYPS